MSLIVFLLKFFFKKKNSFLTFHRRKRFEIYIVGNGIEENRRTINSNPFCVSSVD